MRQMIDMFFKGSREKTHHLTDFGRDKYFLYCSLCGNIYIRTTFLKHLSKCQDGGTLALFFHWKKMPSINSFHLNIKLFKFMLD